MPTPTKPPTFRFAPSPNGYLHLGHALSALVGFRWARRSGGKFLLRIEDIDVTRSRPAFAEAIIEDLGWLGLVWDEPVVYQSSRFGLYREAIETLLAARVLYPCFASRRDIAEAVAASGSTARDPDGAPLYPRAQLAVTATNNEERAAAGEPHALRIDMARALDVAARRLGGRPLAFRALAEDGAVADIEARPELWGDAVIVRKDVPASYHLSVVVDDAAQGVTHVTRGQDLFAATHLQRLLQVLLDLPSPLYHHHRIVTDETGRKLSKSAGDKALRELRAQGLAPADVLARVGLPLAE